ncbi:hypothetical protein [Vibrio phage vB_VmeM-Yong XC32]|nr:hypothetical protein [Vibrio phage vB_VmeM-Yong XC31]QAX96337.1 hypothetical protein [Vibrio phage vB_VmeM-Yong XC32]QAX96655.1 hypothetical protein [Vibrio phage vB_VmeM-Yong MS31]QAX96973.1 hypothetical protein [Vibrio phage vB_VmeM-Yong MS32]
MFSVNAFLPKTEVSMEAIDFQWDRDDVKDIVETIDRIRQEGWNDRNIKASGLDEKVTAMVGAKVNIGAFEGANAYVEFPKALGDHPFYRSYMDYYGIDWEADTKAQTVFMKKHENFHWRVNRTTGRIEGAPEHYEHIIKLGTEFYHKNTPYKFTSEELAAILFHELGHLVSFYEWGYRQSITNFVLTGFVQAVIGAKENADKMNYIFELQQEHGIGKGSEKAILNAKNEDELRVVMYNECIEKSRSDLGLNIYEVRSWESLADQYVSRMGLGVHLAKGMNKLDRAWHTERRTRWGNAVSFAATMTIYLASTFYTGLLAAAALSGGGSIPLALVCFAFVQLVLLSNMYAESKIQQSVYDNPKRRVEVIRLETVARLKDAKDRDTRKMVAMEIEAIDELLENYEDALGVFQWFGKTFFPAGRKAYRSLKGQQLLEDFSNSNLNYLAAKLEG